MKCCASPIISTAAEPAAPPERTARDVVSAVLFREILTPLAKALGPAGDVMLATVVDDLFVRRAR